MLIERVSRGNYPRCRERVIYVYPMTVRMCPSVVLRVADLLGLYLPTLQATPVVGTFPPIRRDLVDFPLMPETSHALTNFLQRSSGSLIAQW